MSEKMSVKALTDGAVMAVLSAGLMMVGGFLPIVGLVISMLSGVPITVLTVKRGSSVGVLGAVVASLLVTVFFGVLAGLSFALQYMLVALTFGWMLAHRKGAGKTLLSGIGVKVIAMALLIMMGFAASGLTMIELQSSYQALTEETIKMYKETGMMEMMQAQGASEQQLRDTMNGMTAFLPAMMAIMGSIGAVVHYLLTISVLKRLKIKVPRMPAFKTWHLPAKSVWGLIAAWSIWLLNDYIQLEGLSVLSQNILLVYGVLLLLTGLSVLMYYLDFQHLSAVWKVAAVIFMLFFFTGVAMVAALAGLFDLVIDIRKIRGKSDDKSVQDKNKP